MNISNIITIRNLKISGIVFLSIILIGFVPLFIFDTHPIINLVKYLFNTYLTLAENITNYVLQIADSNVKIINGDIIFPVATDYVTDNIEIINNWTRYVLFKKWTAFLLLLFWIAMSPIRKKLFYTFLLVFVHFISVTSGLILITVVGPIVVVSDTLTQLQPHTFGAILMIILMSVWIKNSFSEIQNTLKSIKINIHIQKNVVNEIIGVLLVYSLLKNFVVPYFNFFSYIKFLLSVTSGVVSLLGYNSAIDGPYLVGNGGTLYMAKWCLGFLTMYTFASLIFLTSHKNKTMWLYIFGGIIFLHISNIIRLAALFVFVQNNDSSEMANNHHDIYNIVVYAVIFILWVIWFEKFASFNPRKRKNEI